MGRKAKPKLSLQEQEDAVILKYMNGEEMNLEELALALWMVDGRKTKRPMTKTGAMKVVQRILLKLRMECEKRGLKRDDIFDMLDSKRQCAKTNGFERPDGDI